MQKYFLVLFFNLHRQTNNSLSILDFNYIYLPHLSHCLKYSIGFYTQLGILQKGSENNRFNHGNFVKIIQLEQNC